MADDDAAWYLALSHRMLGETASALSAITTYEQVARRKGEDAAMRGKMKVIALVRDPEGIARYLRHLGLPTEEPTMAPARGPPFWGSRVLRRRYGEPPDAGQA